MTKRIFRPSILGVTTCKKINDYIACVKKAGAAAKEIPLIETEDEAKRILQEVDGLVLTGGGDISTAYYHEKDRGMLGAINLKRDQSDYMMLKTALEMDLPVLCICRGMQMLNIVQGGKLYQDILTEYPYGDGIEHRDFETKGSVCHTIQIEKDSLLYNVVKNQELEIASSHHQAVKKLGKGLTVTAISEDGIIEAIEMKDKTYVLGVQFHPEKYALANDWKQTEFFEDLNKHASKYSEKKNHVSTMLLIKNVELYAPFYMGKKDVLLSGGKIEYISEKIELPQIPCQVIDAKGYYMTPGLIDQHVHVTGGGGEGGFYTRTPEVQLSELIKGGVTTVVGLLGTDGMTRSVENLYAKTQALNEEGLTAYMMTGSYSYQGPTITGNPGKDIVFCEKILGVKLALSDHRSSNITSKELVQLASDSRVAGMISGKPGIVVLHMGNGKRGLDPVFEALESSEVPISIFRPTHVGRSPELLEDAYEFLKMGGYIDFTCGSKPGGVTEKILKAVGKKLPTDHITVSSDGKGSWSKYDKEGHLLKMGVSGVDTMLKELQYLVREKKMSLEEALPYFTLNVANALSISEKKGVIKETADADLLLFNSQFELDTVISKGVLMMWEGNVIRKGVYER